MPGRDPRRSGNPSVRASSTGLPASPQARGAFAARSRDLLAWLSRLPPLAVPVAMLVLMLVGLSTPLILAVPALAIAAAFVAWLAVLSWPVLNSGGRLLRIVMLGLVVGAGVGRITGWL